jgi:predicted RNase H-like nuclease (RuvC/YqgF family)
MWSWALTWGCVPELSGNCMDMTNSSSTYLGIIAGAMIGGIISWWIFDRQKKTSEKQDYTLNRIEQLENHNEKLLEKIKVLEEKNEKLLEKIFDLNKKIDSLLESH